GAGLRWTCGHRGDHIARCRTEGGEYARCPKSDQAEHADWRIGRGWKCRGVAPSRLMVGNPPGIDQRLSPMPPCQGKTHWSPKWILHRFEMNKVHGARQISSPTARAVQLLPRYRVRVQPLQIRHFPMRRVLLSPRSSRVFGASGTVKDPSVSRRPS